MSVKMYSIYELLKCDIIIEALFFTLTARLVEVEKYNFT